MIASRKSGMSFQARITAAAMATAVSVLLVACALFTLEQWGGERAMVVPVQNRVAAVLAPEFSDALKAHDQRRIDRMMSALANFPRLTSVRLLDADGRLVGHFQKPAQAAARGRDLSSRITISTDGKPVGTILIHGKAEGAASFLPRYLALTGALFFAATGLSLFLGRMLAKKVIEPVNRLSEVMGEVAVSGDLSRRVKQAEDDEFGRLIESFNALLDRLQIKDQNLHETMQALVAARDQAQAANVQKSQFLANMSHEIRTPLNGVLAMTQVMAMGELPVEQQGRLDVIRNSGEVLLTILNDILDVSKIEAGMLELESVEFDPEPLVRGAVGAVAALAEGKGLDLVLEMGPDAAGPRLGDPARLRQILSNLLSNALKFTSTGAVRILVEGMGEDGAEGLRLVVADSGIGMAAEKLPLLFQKFQQLDASTTRRFGGTGLGLSICQELTEKMGGAIWATSVEGQGATFHVELPIPRVVSAASAPADYEPAEDEERPVRVLAAEDNPTNQLVLSTILEIFGVDLHMVENGREAVEAWTVGDYDIILMDIQMPEMDGITAAREIRKAEAAAGRARTPIVAVSANAMAHQVEEYLAAGMDGHVAKPIELGKLQAALERGLAAREMSKAA
jgi:signal transduction histidine kinase/ActR/RegA family two-component response regulator